VSSKKSSGQKLCFLVLKCDNSANNFDQDKALAIFDRQYVYTRTAHGRLLAQSVDAHIISFSCDGTSSKVFLRNEIIDACLINIKVK
jgi:hypothetical protein